jgi:hypothetical protein
MAPDMCSVVAGIEQQEDEGSGNDMSTKDDSIQA